MGFRFYDIVDKKRSMVSRESGGGAKFIINRHDRTFPKSFENIYNLTFVELHDYICFSKLTELYAK